VPSKTDPEEYPGLLAAALSVFRTILVVNAPEGKRHRNERADSPHASTDNSPHGFFAKSRGIYEYFAASYGAMKRSKPLLVKSPPGTHGYRHSPFLFFLMLAIIVVVFVYLLIRPTPHEARSSKSLATPSRQQ